MPASFVAYKYAGQVFKAFLNGAIKGGQAGNFLAEHRGQFEKPLVERARRGPGALTSTHFILEQADQHYREKMEALQTDHK